MKAEINYYNDDYESSHVQYSQLTSYNPSSGKFWYRRAYSAYRINNYQDAIIAFKKDIKLGYGQRAPYHLSKCLALTGQTEESLDWLEYSVGRNTEFLFDAPGNDDFRSIKNTARFKELVVPKTNFENRVEGWRYDLMYLKNKLESLHHNILRNDSKKHRMTKEDWEERVKTVYELIPKMKDHQIMVEMMKLVNGVGDGHTALVPDFSKKKSDYKFHRVPILFTQFSDGLFITSASKELGHLVGKKVVKIGAIDESMFLEKVAEVFPHDSEAGLEWGLELIPAISEIMHALGMSESSTEITYTLRGQAGLEEITIEAELDLDGEMMEEWFYGYHKEKKWIHLNELENETLPLWRQNMKAHYWFQYLDEVQAMYFQYNQVKTMESEDFETFLVRFFKEISNKKAKNLVLDLRTNEGGDNSLIRPLVLEITKLSQLGELENIWIAIGSRTHSAAVNLVGQLKYFADVTLVGTPTSGSPNFVGETSRGVFQLPYSKLFVNASTHLWQSGLNAMDTRSSFVPDIYIDQTSEQYRENEDPILNFLIDYLKAK